MTPVPLSQIRDINRDRKKNSREQTGEMISLERVSLSWKSPFLLFGGGVSGWECHFLTQSLEGHTENFEICWYGRNRDLVLFLWPIKLTQIESPGRTPTHKTKTAREILLNCFDGRSRMLLCWDFPAVLEFVRTKTYSIFFGSIFYWPDARHSAEREQLSGCLGFYSRG